MNTTEFYNFAVLAATERGYEKPSITTHAMCRDGNMYYICSLWLGIKHKHIESGQHNNPIAAIQAFKDAIDYEKLTYSKQQEDMDLTQQSPTK